MNIWQSVGLMTLLDLAIFGISLAALWILYRRRQAIRQIGTRSGPWLVALGLLGIGLFYLVDLFVMWVLPALTTREAAMRTMERLHLDYNWVVTLLAAGAVLFGLTRTVTAMARQSAALSRSESLFESLYQRTPVMLHSVDPEGRLLTVSDHWLELLEYEREEVLGRPAVDFLTDASREHARDACMPEFFETGVLMNAPLQFRKKSGETVEVLLSSVAIRDESGQITRSVAASADVTELRRSEAELARLRQVREMILRAAGEGIYGLDHEGMSTFVNPAAAEILGWAPEELLGRSMHQVLHHTKRDGTPYPREECPIYAAFTDGQVRRDVDEVFWRKDGSSVDVRYTSTPLKKDGELIGAVVVFRDISRIRQAQEALRDSEERYRAVFEASASGLAIRRLADSELIAVNPALTMMFGYSPEEFLKLQPEDYLPPEAIQVYRELVETVSRGETYRFMSRGRHRDGSEFALEGHAVPLLYKGEPHFLSMTRDVTEQRRAEEQREKAFEEIARLKDELERERDYLREEVNVSLRFGGIVGESPPLKQVLAQIEAVAGTNATVLILGESGVGKELVARAIHENSSRSARPMVKVNCASIPRELFESEFFGHVRGAFTGAQRDRVGRFELADGGTLFLDEVGETPIELQGKLLRVLEEGEFERVGEGRTRKVDVRVVSATNRDLRDEVKADRFREDLFFRLSVFPLEVPPLRERPEDVEPLAAHFLEMARAELGREELALSRFQADALRGYGWPGNIRELRNVIERAVILSPGEHLRLDLAMPGTALSAERDAAPAQSGAGFLTEAEFRRRERDNLVAALEQSNWRVAGEHGAARRLGLNTSTVRYRMKAMDIKRPGRS